MNAQFERVMRATTKQIAEALQIPVRMLLPPRTVLAAPRPWWALHTDTDEQPQRDPAERKKERRG